jgi:hypothetical protein
MKNQTMRKSVRGRLLPALLALALALALSLSGVTSVFADDPPVVEAAITKVLRLHQGTTVPSATFKFDITPISVNGDDYNSTSANMPTRSAISITYPAFPPGVVTTTDAIHAVDIIKKESVSIFAGVTFTHAGNYIYEVTENEASSYQATPGREIITYSKAKYTLEVVVSEAPPNSGQFSIKSITARRELDDNGEEAQGRPKVNPSPDPDGDLSEMDFTNTYVKVNPGNPEVPENAPLYVSKTVEGDIGDKTKYFDFTVIVTQPYLLVTTEPVIYKAYVVEDGEVVTSDSNGWSDSVGGTDNDNNKYFNFTSAITAGTIKLKHGQKLVFVDTHVGTTYKATESYADYIPSVTVYAKDSIRFTQGGGTGGYIWTEHGYVVDDNNRAEFTNTKNSQPITGIVIDNLPYIGLIALAVGALALYLAAKRRRRRSYAMAERQQ